MRGSRGRSWELTIKANHLDARRRRFFRLSAELALLDERRLRDLFDASEATTGWGRNHVIEVGREKVFVKRIPLTDPEMENPFSTRNVLGLPIYYNYGVGSAGFGAFRELAANVKATNWVLGGEIATFPMLYHHRIRPASGTRTPTDMERHRGYVEYWGGNENIGRYMLDRAEAGHELVLFLEYVPHVLGKWLTENSEKTGGMIASLLETCEFMRQKGMVHFDAHFHNVVTDGVRPYLTDFGLALDRGFDLTPEERAFHRAHAFYDFGEVLSCIAHVVDDLYRAQDEAARKRLDELLGVDETSDGRDRTTRLVQKIDEVKSSGLMPLSPSVVKTAKQYERVIVLMREFFGAMHRNKRKDTVFPATELRRRLADAGVVSARR